MELKSEPISTDLTLRASPAGYFVSGEILKYPFKSDLSLSQQSFHLQIPQTTTSFENGIFRNYLEIDEIRQTLEFNTETLVLVIDNNKLGGITLSPRDIYSFGEAYITGKTYTEFVESLINDRIIQIRSDFFSFEITSEPKLTYADDKNHLFISIPEGILEVDAKFSDDSCLISMNIEKMQISASGIIKTAEFEFDINSVNHARLAVVINGTTYTAIYENNELKISIPDYVSLSMKITDMTAQGTVDIENLGRILINHLAFMNIRNGAFPILIPTESDIILQLGETDIKSKTLIENNIFQYQIESEISSSLKMTFEGKFGGQIDDFFNLETYDLVFANNFFVGTGYVSQEFNNDISLRNGIFNLKSHVNTILLKTDIEMRLSGLTLEKLILDNVLINTKIGEDELYVIGGVMYERNAIFAIKQTQVSSLDYILVKIFLQAI